MATPAQQQTPTTTTTRRPTWAIAHDIANAFDPETGEIDEARVNALTAELADKAEAVHHVIRAWDAECEAIKAERERLAKRAAEIVARGDRLAAYLTRCLVDAGTRKVSTALITCSVVQGSERVEVTCEPDALPAEYQRKKVEADKAEIKAALKAGVEVPGCSLVRGPDTIRFR